MQNPFSPNLDKISCDAYEKKKKKKKREDKKKKKK